MYLRLKPFLFFLLVVGTLFALHTCCLLAQKDSASLFPILIGTLVIAYIAVRLSVILPLGNPSVSTDTESYLLFDPSKGEWLHQLTYSLRPFTLPTFFSLAGKDPLLIAWSQSAISIFSWCVLAWVIYRSINRRWLGILGAALVLCISLGQHVLIWDWILLSESLSFSLFILVVAGSLVFINKQDLFSGSGFLVLAFLWMNTRADLAFQALIISLGLMGLGAFKKPWRFALRYGIILLCLSGLSIFSSLISHRSFLTTYHTLEIRTFRQQGAIDFFMASGMPVNEKGQPDLESSVFRDWVASDGTRILAIYILRGFPLSFLEPFQVEEFPTLDDFTTFHAAHFKSVLPLVDQDRINSYLWTGLWFCASALLIGVILFRVRKPLISYGGIAVTMIVLAYPMAILIWHADGYETQRHWLGVSLELILGVVLGVMFIMDSSELE